MIDTHCHLDFPQFDSDREFVLTRCQLAGINKIIVPGTQASRWPTQISICKSSSSLSFALGIHPYYAGAAIADDLDKLDKLLNLHRTDTVAIGETGLDFHLPEESHQSQIDFFIEQIHLANKYRLPLILHHRKSHNETIRLLKQQHFVHSGVVHAFSGSLQEANSYIDMGFKLGAGGTITYARATKTRDTFKLVPLESIVLETDAPDMPMSGRQGQRNSPEYLGEVARHLAGIRGISVSEVVEQTNANSTQLFALT